MTARRTSRTCPACRCGLHPIWNVAFMEADRAFFERYPEARSYVRETFPTEHPFRCVGVEWVIVYQIAPGVRARREVA